MLCSVLNQSYSNWECLVIDDVNDSVSKEVTQSFNDNRIQYLNRGDSFSKGLPGCRNFGLTLVDGDYIQFIDDDDVLHPSFLETKIKAIDGKDDIDYIITPLQNFTTNIPEAEKEDTYNSKENRIDWREYALGKLGIFSCSVLWRKECWTDIMFDETLKVSEDFDVYWRLFQQFKNGLYLDAPHYYRRLHEQTNSNKLRLRSKRFNRDYLKTRKRYLRALLEKETITDYEILHFLALGYKFEDEELIRMLNTSAKNLSIKTKLKLFKLFLKHQLKKKRGC